MSNAWEKASERANQSGGGKFVRLADDKDAVIGQFVGDPHVVELFYNTKLDKYEPATAEQIEQKKSTARFLINFFVPDVTGTGKDKKILPSGSMKIIEINSNTFKDVAAVIQKYGADWLFEIVRNGKKGDQKTKYNVLPECKIPDEIAAIVAKTELHDLTKEKSDDASTDMNSHDKSKANGGAAAAAPTGPTLASPEDVKAIIERLKPKEKVKIDAFMKQFGIAQVKQLKASDVDAAKKLLDEWEGKTNSAAAPEAPADVDPFA